MITEAKRKPALRAINDIMVCARTMAYEKKSHERIAGLLDLAEELPMLVVREEDTTNEFRSALESIASVYPEAAIALQRFAGDIPT